MSSSNLAISGDSFSGCAFGNDCAVVPDATVEEAVDKGSAFGWVSGSSRTGADCQEPECTALRVSSSIQGIVDPVPDPDIDPDPWLEALPDLEDKITTREFWNY